MEYDYKVNKSMIFRKLILRKWTRLRMILNLSKIDFSKTALLFTL